MKHYGGNNRNGEYVSKHAAEKGGKRFRKENNASSWSNRGALKTVESEGKRYKREAPQTIDSDIEEIFPSKRKKTVPVEIKAESKIIDAVGKRFKDELPEKAAITEKTVGAVGKRFKAEPEENKTVSEPVQAETVGKRFRADDDGEAVPEAAGKRFKFEDNEDESSDEKKAGDITLGFYKEIKQKVKQLKNNSQDKTSQKNIKAAEKTEAPKLSKPKNLDEIGSELMYVPTESEKILKNYIPGILFLVFMLGMVLWFLIAPKTDYSLSEKRVLQKFPDISLQNVASGNFGDEFEKYFADHFPQRNFWVGFNAYYGLALGNNGANGVYSGKDGYLINKPVSVDNNIDKNVNVVCDFKNTLGDIPVTMMLAPSTGYIAEDKLPLVHDAYNDDTFFEKISGKLSENGISFVDLRQTFKDEYANGSKLYYRTDHHWTTYGAYTAYTKLCESLNIQPIERDSLTIENYDGFYGTTYSSSGFWFVNPDNIEVWRNPANTGDNISVTITEGQTVIRSDSMYFYDHIENDDKYPVFIDGNHALTEIVNTNAKGGTAVVLKDSFCHSLAPFLAENYQKIILVDMRYYKQSVSNIIKFEKPEQVFVIYGVDNFSTDSDLVFLE